MRLLDLYRHTDVNFARVLESRAKLTAIAPPGSMERKPIGQISAPDLPQLRAYFSEAVGTAAKFLARPDGSRVGALALDGWDTHIDNFSGVRNLCRDLDPAMSALLADLTERKLLDERGWNAQNSRVV